MGQFSLTAIPDTLFNATDCTTIAAVATLCDFLRWYIQEQFPDADIFAICLDRMFGSVFVGHPESRAKEAALGWEKRNEEEECVDVVYDYCY